MAQESEELLRLRAAGLRATPQRLQILRLLAHRRDHPTAEDLHRALRAHHPTLSLSTVYATLDSLERVGLCRRLRLGEGRERYEAYFERHDHVVCLSCHAVEDVPPGPEHASPEIARLGFVPAFSTVTYYGYCRACREGRSPGEAPRTPAQG